MSNLTLVHPTSPAEPALVVFGRDGTGKPRASWFDAASAELATKAAGLMKMRVLKLATEEQKTLARQLAPGRVFASGRAFTPFARAAVFSQLVELAGGATGQASGAPRRWPRGLENGGAPLTATRRSAKRLAGPGCRPARTAAAATLGRDRARQPRAVQPLRSRTAGGRRW